MPCIPVAIVTLYFAAVVQAGWIPMVDGAVSTFADNGFLAHNTMTPGVMLEGLQPGDEINVTCDDGRELRYIVREKCSYQAVNLRWYVDERTGEGLTDGQLFRRVYNQPDTITLQTCIHRGGVDTWGRLFIVAELQRGRHGNLIQ